MESKEEKQELQQEVSTAIQSLDKGDIKDIIQKLLSDAIESTSKKENELIPYDSNVEILNTLANRFHEKYDFKRGDIVTWKEGLKNKSRPLENEPAIVLEMLQEPLFDNQGDSGSPYYREPLDLVVGVFIKEKFIIYHLDSRRLKIMN